MARQAPKNQKSSGMNRFYLILGVVALLGIAAIAYAILGGGKKPVDAPIDVAGLDNPQSLVEKAVGVAMGDPNAPVKIIEFGDYQCPGCGYFATTIKPAIKQKYIDTGKVHFVFYDFPLSGHPHSFLVARAVRCGGEQNKFWEMHDIVYARQQEWSPKQNVAKDLSGYAKQIGLDVSKFDDCLNSDRFADVVTANLRLGEQLGVNSTPTVIVNSRNITEWSTEDLSREIDRELAALGR